MGRQAESLTYISDDRENLYLPASRGSAVGARATFISAGSFSSVVAQEIDDRRRLLITVELAEEIAFGGKNRETGRHHFAGQFDLPLSVGLGEFLALLRRDRLDRDRIHVKLDWHKLLEQCDDLGFGSTPRSITGNWRELTPVKSIRIGRFSAAANSRAWSKLMPQTTP